MKLEQVPALLLAWITIGADPQGTGLALGGGGFTLGDAGFGFAIHRLRFRCATTHDRQSLDHHGLFIEPGANDIFVADARLLARFAALAPVMDLAAFDGGLVQGRPEARRGGKACVSTCRARWSPDY